jgi:putative hydrolase of the HAD superfamily
MTRSRGVLFDLDDTLLDTAGVERRRWDAVTRLVCSRFPEADRAAMRQRYRAFSDGREAVDLGRAPYDGFRRARLVHALAPWGRADAELLGNYLELSNRIADTITVLPGATAAIAAARMQRLRVGILTNGPSAWQRHKLEVTGIETLVDAVAISGELGRAKPDPAAFHAACALLGTTPAETSMVGDSQPMDIAGARAAGLARAIWVGAAPLDSVPGLLAA